MKGCIAEDFGRLVEIDHPKFRLFVACTNGHDGKNSWQVFTFAEGGRGFWESLPNPRGRGSLINCSSMWTARFAAIHQLWTFKRKMFMAPDKSRERTSPSPAAVRGCRLRY